MQVQNAKFPLLYLSFNQDGSCIAVGTRKGFRVFNAVPFKPLYSHDFSDGCGVVSMLYRSSILAISGAGNNLRYPRDSVTLYDDQSGRNLGEVELHHAVLNVQLTREKIFVAVDGAVHVHNITDLRQVDKIETCANPNGLLAVQGERDVQILCLGMRPGEVVLRQYTSESLTAVQSFQCHETALRCVQFSPDGKYFATASQKGTLIRIFGIEEKKMIREVRRGSQESTIFSIAFSPDNTKLACTSDHGTIHVFCAINQPDEEVENKKSGLKFLGGMNKYFDSEWSFAKFNVECNVSICRFAGNDQLVVLCGDGQYYKLKVNKDELVKEVHESMLAEK
ncbi:WD40_repeat protein [Hexamita inflata]|uniref:WD40 repeat protein n=1 Tax=Hexamita inflata TaxID=28002 RepID=A0AA86UD93_9EUKA|nr:WD40 repeat protein [Hexamita inflata]CAI9953605.1 WD40 repeat protein [Hexamita inflata]CAI9966098.1 WD40 repeat protein [Hexamita inflata]